jgi:hypothetical protein
MTAEGRFLGLDMGDWSMSLGAFALIAVVALLI